MTSYAIDTNGWPILLAEPPKKPEEPVKPPLTPSARPASMNHVEWARRQDAVREAAREFEQLSEQDLKERLKGLTSRPLTDAEISIFRADVRAAQLDDLIDLLDQAERGRLRTRRTVRVSAPRGYVQKTLRALTSTEVGELAARLAARGWSQEQIAKRLPDAPSRPPAVQRPAPTPVEKDPEPPTKLADEPQETYFELHRGEDGLVKGITKRTIA